MKVKVGQKIRIGKSAKCIEALGNFYLDENYVKPVLGRLAFVREITTFAESPAVHLRFRNMKSIHHTHVKSPVVYWPVSVLRKP